MARDFGVPSGGSEVRGEWKARVVSQAACQEQGGPDVSGKQAVATAATGLASGEGDNTIVVFDHDAGQRRDRLVTDPELSPLDLTLAPNGHIVISSEYPFGAPDAVVSIREYDPATGQLVRVLVPHPSGATAPAQRASAGATRLGLEAPN